MPSSSRKWWHSRHVRQKEPTEQPYGLAVGQKKPILLPNCRQGTSAQDLDISMTLQGYTFSDHHWTTFKPGFFQAAERGSYSVCRHSQVCHMCSVGTISDLWREQGANGESASYGVLSKQTVSPRHSCVLLEKVYYLSNFCQLQISPHALTSRKGSGMMQT